MILREQIEQIEAWILSGKDDRHVVRLCKQELKISRSTAYRQIAKIKKRIGEAVQSVDPNEVKARVQGMLLYTFEKAERLGDAKAMATVCQRIAELHGVMAPRKFEHSGKIETTPDALHDRLTSIVARASGAAHAPAAGKANGNGTNGASGSN
jgi:hypothetical protein